MFSRVLEVAAFEAFSYVCNQTLSAISRVDFKNNILTFYHNISLPLHKLKQVHAACVNQTFGSLTGANHTFFDPHALNAPNNTHTHLVPCNLFNSTQATSMVQQLRQIQRAYGVTMLSNADSHGLLTQFSAYENQLGSQLAERYDHIEQVVKNVERWQELKETVRTDIIISFFFMVFRNRLISNGAPKKYVEPIMSMGLLISYILSNRSLDKLFLLMLPMLFSIQLLPNNFRYHKELFTTLSIAAIALQTYKNDSQSYSFSAVKLLASSAASLLTRYVVNGIYEQRSERFRFFNALPNNAQLVVDPAALMIIRRGR